MRRVLVLVLLAVMAASAGGSGRAVAQAANPIRVSDYTLTPPYLADRGGDGLSSWKLRWVNPYADNSYNFSEVEMPTYGCTVPPDQPRQIILQGIIGMQPDVNYRIEYEISGATPVWRTLLQLPTDLLSEGNGSFSVNWFDTESWCPTRNVYFRVAGTDSAGNQYASAIRKLQVFPAVTVKAGPKEPPHYRVGTVIWRKIRVKDPGVTRIQLRRISKLDPGHHLRIGDRTRFRFIKNLPVVKGWVSFKFRIPDKKTYIFRFTFPPTERHSKYWLFDMTYAGL